jgi:hypothetical protein
MIDRKRLIHVVFIAPDGSRSYFVRTDRRFDSKTGQSVTWPLVDTEPRNSVSMIYEFAEVSKKLWSGPPFNLTVRLALEAGPNADFVDEGNGSPSSVPWQFKDYLVTCTAEGEPLDSLDAPYCLKVRAVNTPDGRKFVLRAENPSLTQPSVFSTFDEGPEYCVAKAWDLGYRNYPVIANPQIEQRRQEAERQAQREASARFGTIRPGDRVR